MLRQALRLGCSAGLLGACAAIGVWLGMAGVVATAALAAAGVQGEAVAATIRAESRLNAQILGSAIWFGRAGTPFYVIRRWG